MRHPFAPKWRRVVLAEPAVSGVFRVRRPTYGELLEFHQDRNAIEPCIERDDGTRVFHENGLRFSECDAEVGSVFTDLVLGKKSHDGEIEEDSPTTPR